MNIVTIMIMIIVNVAIHRFDGDATFFNVTEWLCTSIIQNSEIKKNI